MKKTISLSIIVLLFSFLAACQSVEKENKTSATFTGTIEEINGQSALVSIEEGEILNSGNSVNIDLSVNSKETFHVGDRVKVSYDGEVRESLPLSVNVIDIEIVR